MLWIAADGPTIDDGRSSRGRRAGGRDRAGRVDRELHMSRSVEHRPPLVAGGPPIEVVRSTRRRRSASAHARDGRIVVQLPARMSRAEADRTIVTLVARVTGQARAQARGGDDWLAARAAQVAARWVGGVEPRAVTWSSRMQRRWASATPSTGEIRVSDRAAALPDRVLDHLLVHELAHLLVPDHSPEFHALVAAHPHAEWAKGFLAGLAHAEAQGVAPGDAGIADEPG